MYTLLPVGLDLLDSNRGSRRSSSRWLYADASAMRGGDVMYVKSPMGMGVRNSIDLTIGYSLLLPLVVCGIFGREGIIVHEWETRAVEARGAW